MSGPNTRLYLIVMIAQLLGMGTNLLVFTFTENGLYGILAGIFLYQGAKATCMFRYWWEKERG